MHLAAFILILLLAWLCSRHQRRVARRRGGRVLRRHSLRDGVLMGVVFGALRSR